MKVVIIGVGVIGGFYGVVFVDVGMDVFFIVCGKIFIVICEYGLCLVGNMELIFDVFVIDDVVEIGQVDVVLLCIKIF